MELSSASETYDETPLFSEVQTTILDLYYIPVYMQTSLFEDDGFKQNQILRELVQIAKDMSVYVEDDEWHLEWMRQINTVG